MFSHGRVRDRRKGQIWRTGMEELQARAVGAMIWNKTFLSFCVLLLARRGNPAEPSVNWQVASIKSKGGDRSIRAGEKTKQKQQQADEKPSSSISRAAIWWSKKIIDIKRKTRIEDSTKWAGRFVSGLLLLLLSSSLMDLKNKMKR